MIFVALLFSSLSLADTDITISKGIYTPIDSITVLERRRQSSLEQTLSASNILVRTIAGSKLANQPHICSQYALHHDKDQLFVTCDAKPTIAVQLNGTPTQYPKDDGTMLDVIAVIQNNQITQSFTFDNGMLKVIYTITPDCFWVEKTIYSTYLGMPLSIKACYQHQQ